MRSPKRPIVECSVMANLRVFGFFVVIGAVMPVVSCLAALLFALPSIRAIVGSGAAPIALFALAMIGLIASFVSVSIGSGIAVDEDRSVYRNKLASFVGLPVHALILVVLAFFVF
jgi:hypothetical protein